MADDVPTPVTPPVDKPKAKAPPKPKAKAPEPFDEVLTPASPKFPPIDVRYQSLYQCPAEPLVLWGQSVDKAVKDQKTAIEAIMRSEYGDDVYEAWAETARM